MARIRAEATLHRVAFSSLIEALVARKEAIYCW